MLFGSWLINLYLSIAVFIIVFLGSLGNNLIITTSFRATVAFLITYLSTYFFRWLWAFSLAPPQSKETEKDLFLPGNDIKEEYPIDNRDYSEEEIKKAGNYVRELLDDKEV
ncbi:MAG: hypothetical protein LPK26_22895 [Bacillaceae bacterium]|nr:hypothetical protein [Bacillaceae bacterium]